MRRDGSQRFCVGTERRVESVAAVDENWWVHAGDGSKNGILC
jgi:hypothetical protein